MSASWLWVAHFACVCFAFVQNDDVLHLENLFFFCVSVRLHCLQLFILVNVEQLARQEFGDAVKMLKDLCRMLDGVADWTGMCLRSG